MAHKKKEIPIQVVQEWLMNAAMSRSEGLAEYLEIISFKIGLDAKSDEWEISVRVKPKFTFSGGGGPRISKPKKSKNQGYAARISHRKPSRRQTPVHVN